MIKSTYTIEHNRLMGDLRTALQRGMARLSSEANGGKSILFVYPPVDEELYIAEAKETLTDCQFIDLRKLFVRFIDENGLEELKETYQEFGNEIFESKNFKEGTFFSLLLDEINRSFEEKKIPVLVHTGTIYSMGFSNINIMEHPSVMQSQIPLVVFYPATIENNSIRFLDKEIASNYRCMVVN